MKAWKPLLAGILGTSLAVACERITEPETTTSIETAGPAFNFSNGPEVSGKVFRFSIDSEFFWINVDEVSNLGIFLSPENALRDNFLDLCGTTTATSPMDFHWVQNPQFIIRLLVQDKSAYAYVFDLQPEWLGTQVTCEELLEHLIATGQVRFQYNDNDWFLTGNGTNTAFMRAGGELEDLVNGGTVKLHMTGHWQFLQDGTFRTIKSVIRLSPDPRTS